MREAILPVNTLADLFSDCFSLVLQLKQLKDYGDPAELRRQIGHLFAAAEAKGRRLEFDKADVEEGKYALVAFLDEVILNSEWLHKEEWSSQPLQLEYFGTHLAGEEFFTRLDKLTKEETARPEIIEVYYLCLTLGFEGKYRVLGRDRLRTLITDVHARLAQMHESSAQGLSPNWKRPAETLGALGGRFPSWAPAAFCVVIVVLIIVLLNFVLSRDISSAQHSLL